MKAFLIAVGTAATAYFILNHMPTWVIVLSVFIDTHEIITYLHDRK